MADEYICQEDCLDEDTQEEYSVEQELAIKSFARDFHNDVKILAKHHIEDFFKDKMLYCGGKVPQRMLSDEKRISMVLNYDIIQGVEHAYQLLESTVSQKELEASKYSGEATSDILLVNEILNLLAKSGIPQQFAGGMMILYLEFVEGF